MYHYDLKCVTCMILISIIKQACDLDAKLIFHPFTSSTFNNLADVGLGDHYF